MYDSIAKFPNLAQIDLLWNRNVVVPCKPIDEIFRCTLGAG